MRPTNWCLVKFGKSATSVFHTVRWRRLNYLPIIFYSVDLNRERCDGNYSSLLRPRLDESRQVGLFDSHAMGWEALEFMKKLNLLAMCNSRLLFVMMTSSTGVFKKQNCKGFLAFLRDAAMAAWRSGWHFLVWDFNKLLPDHRLEVSDQNWWHWGEDELHPLWWSSGYSTAWFEKSRFPVNPLLEKFAAKCANYCWSWHPANIFFMQMLLDVENQTENSNGCMAYLAGASFRSSLRQWISCGMMFLTEWTVGFAQTYSCQWVGCYHWCQRLRWKITALRDGYATKAWWNSYVQGAMEVDN